MIQIENTCQAMRLFSGFLGSLEELDTYEWQRVADKRKDDVWNLRMNECRRICAKSLESMADILQMNATDKMENQIEDPKTERLLKKMFRKRGIRMDSMKIHMFAKDKIGLDFFLKSLGDNQISSQNIENWISEQLGRSMYADRDNSPGIGETMQLFRFYEKPLFHTIHGIAKVGKDCGKISGDNFSFLDLKNGWEMAAVSDGMGSGEVAGLESNRVIDMLEEFLKIGIKAEDAISLINSAIVMGRSRICFSTLDFHTWNLYTGQCKSLKAGASITILKRGEELRRLYSDTLPVGVITDLQVAAQEMQLQDDDYLIMITDGILDALPVAEQDFLLEGIIRGSHTNNPKELAEHILQQVLEWRGGEPQDDMLVLVTGIWESR